MTVGKAIDLMLLPLMGTLWMYTYSELFFGRCYPICEVDRPKWEVSWFHKYYRWISVPTYAIAGLASYVVLQEQSQIFQPPLITYAATLGLHWIHYPLHRTRIHLAIADACLATMTAVYTAKLFYDVKTSAGYMMAPFVVILIQQTLWDGWCYKRHKDWLK